MKPKVLAATCCLLALAGCGQTASHGTSSDTTAMPVQQVAATEPTTPPATSAATVPADPSTDFCNELGVLELEIASINANGGTTAMTPNDVSKVEQDSQQIEADAKALGGDYWTDWQQLRADLSPSGDPSLVNTDMGTLINLCPSN